MERRRYNSNSNSKMKPRYESTKIILNQEIGTTKKLLEHLIWKTKTNQAGQKTRKLHMKVFESIKKSKWEISYKSIWIKQAWNTGYIDYMFLSYHVHISEWIHTLQLPECQGTPLSKQARYLNFKWLQRDLYPQPLSS